MKRSRSLLPQISTSMQNSEECSQERKSSIPQAQNQRDGLQGQTWATGLDGLPSQYGAQRQAVEYFVRCLIRFQNRSSHFWCFTSISPSERFPLRWVESALPRDPTFSQINNDYDKPSFKRICAEFGFSLGAYFCFQEGDNHSLGSVFIYVTKVGPEGNPHSHILELTSSVMKVENPSKVIWSTS